MRIGTNGQFSRDPLEKCMNLSPGPSLGVQLFLRYSPVSAGAAVRVSGSGHVGQGSGPKWCLVGAYDIFEHYHMNLKSRFFCVGLGMFEQVQ